MPTRKLNAIEEEKFAGFAELHTITTGRNVDNLSICRKMIEESKLSVSSIKLYMGKSYF